MHILLKEQVRLLIFYLTEGIRIHRFYIKCSVCSAEITFRTDPQNTDYALESGATRNFEMWRENSEISEQEKKLREEEDKLDAMKGLENRTLDSKVEMDILDALDEIKAINQRHERVDTHDILKVLNYPSISSENNIFHSNVTNSGSVVLNSDGLSLEDVELLKSFKSKKRVKNNLSDDDLSENEMVKESKSNFVNTDNAETRYLDEPLISKIKDELQSQHVKAPQESIIVVKKKRKLDIIQSPSMSIANNESNVKELEIPDDKLEVNGAFFGDYGSDSD